MFFVYLCNFKIEGAETLRRSDKLSFFAVNDGDKAPQSLATTKSLLSTLPSFDVDENKDVNEIQSAITQR